MLSVAADERAEGCGLHPRAPSPLTLKARIGSPVRIEVASDVEGLLNAASIERAWQILKRSSATFSRGAFSPIRFLHGRPARNIGTRRPRTQASSGRAASPRVFSRVGSVKTCVT